MIRVFYKTHDELVTECFSSIELESGDNEIGLKGLVMYPEHDDYAVYVYIPDSDKSEIYSMLTYAAVNGYLCIEGYHSIVSKEDMWSFDEEDIEGLNKSAGTSFRRSNDSTTQKLTEAVNHMVWLIL